MIPDADIWCAALLMTRCFRREAADQAAACADDLLAVGEVDGMRDVEADREGDRAASSTGADRG